MYVCTYVRTYARTYVRMYVCINIYLPFRTWRSSDPNLKHRLEFTERPRTPLGGQGRCRPVQTQLLPKNMINNSSSSSSSSSHNISSSNNHNTNDNTNLNNNPSFFFPGSTLFRVRRMCTAANSQQVVANSQTHDTSEFGETLCSITIDKDLNSGIIFLMDIFISESTQFDPRDQTKVSLRTIKPTRNEHR